MLAHLLGKTKRNPGTKETPGSDTTEHRPALLSAVICVQLSEVLMTKEEDSMTLTDMQLLSDTEKSCQASASSPDNVSVFCGREQERRRTRGENQEF